ncbi:CPBP family glutamic-type intramembrane protease [Roseateles chitinivorans]|uniref:CPBP family glutamic-type intramembrane protease n=1 Tax=Roseateles chitinivorans TaxID=2917965 RepID=UPI003D668C9D
MPLFLPVPIPWDVVLRQLLLAPCFEEILFRLGLQERLSTARAAAARRHAVVLTALAFGAAHAIVLAIVTPAPPLSALLLALATAVPAWWIGRGYRRHRSLPRCIAWHAGFNACWLLAAPVLLPLLLSTSAPAPGAPLSSTASVSVSVSASLSSS